MNKTPFSWVRKFVSLSASLSLVAVPSYPLIAHGNTTNTMVAPNLMIILGNSYSMNREMDNIRYPKTPDGKEIQDKCPASYSSTSDYLAVPSFAHDTGCGGAGTFFAGNQYGNQPTSKIYIAKKVLYDLLSSSKSDSINFGFATFRQAFGLQLSTSTVLTNAFWPNVFPSGGTPDNPLPGDLSNQTTEYLNTYGADYSNFSWVSWWPTWDSVSGAPFAIGKKTKNGPDQPNNNQVQPFASTVGGLPLSIQYPPGQQSPYFQYNAPFGNYYYGSGGLDYDPPINDQPGAEPPKFNLCRTYYNSQGNSWQAVYISSNPDGSPRMVVNTYPNLYTANTLQFISIGSKQYNPDGSMDSLEWSDYCSVNQRNVSIKQQSSMVSDEIKDPSTNFISKAYFSYIPSIYDTTSEAGIGAFTGWSGAATYDPSSNSYTASYPSGPQSASKMGSYNKSGAPYMGVFVDLPNPSAGYIDQRSMIQGLINPAYPQWDDSGLGYDPNTQTITNNGKRQSISASSFPADYNPFQSPVYDSLMNAAAYFSAYKKVDQFDICRTNRVLLIYDGHEDANYTRDSQGNIIYADPAKAAALLKSIGVETNVVIISNNPGDIAQADAIAAAGGTGSAFKVNNAIELIDAIASVFAGLQGTVTSGSPAIAGQVKSGSLIYSAVSNDTYGSMAGHLYAYRLNSDGTVDTSNPVFDAASPQFQANRASKLWSDSLSNGLRQMTSWNSLPDAAFATNANPDATTVKTYTIDPNAYNGAYLAGRASGSYVGTMTSPAADPVYVGVPSNPLLLNKTGYREYVQSQSNRNPSVLWSADDGFLYSSNATSGELNWAYMPSPLLADLKNYNNFQAGRPMDGGFVVADGVGADGNWHSFVFGTSKGGAIHYSLQLDSSGNLSSSPVVVDNQEGYVSPDAAKPLITWDASGVAYGLYVTVKEATAKLNVISSKGEFSSANLPFVPSSLLTIDHFTGAIYVGAIDGSVYALYTNNGYSATEIVGTFNAQHSLIGNMPNTSDPAKYVGFYQSGSGVYIWAAGKKQIVVFSIGSNGWQSIWTTAVNGPSTQLVNGSTVTYSSDPGADGPGPQFLPNSGFISDAPAVVSGVMIVPVTTIPAGSVQECTAGNAWYYLFRMDNGEFPKGVVTKNSGVQIEDNINIGAGIAFSPVIAYNVEVGGYSIYGSAQQDNMAKSLIDLVGNIGNPNARSGIIGLRPLMITHP